MHPLSYVRKQTSRFVGDSGVCEDDPRVVEAINDVRRLLYPLGDWKGTVDHVCIKPHAGYYSLPPEYEYAKEASHACRGIVIQNDWFQKATVDDEKCFAGKVVKEDGEYATIRDWPCVPRKAGHECCQPEGFYLKLVPEDDRDCGTEITFHGIGVGSRHISLTRTLGRGWSHSKAQPGEERMIQLQHAIKPITNGRIRVYGYDGTNELLLAIYDPDVTLPKFTRYRVNCSFRGPLIFKCKKRFREIVDDGKQIVDLNIDALIHALQAITDRENRRINEYSANIGLATALLNRELQGPESTSTTPMKMAPAYRMEGLIF